VTNVLIVDDERMVQELFRHYIETAADRYRLAGAIKGAANAELACLRAQVDLILMDVCTADNESGLAAAASIKKKYPQVKNHHGHLGAGGELSQKGARRGRRELLVQGGRHRGAAQRHGPHDGGRARLARRRARGAGGPGQQRRFYAYGAQGAGLHRAGQIHRRDRRAMGVDYETTRTHIKNLKEKTGAPSLTALAALAAGTRLVLPEY
jgi:CheY-like chemotaxis protein